MWTYIMEIPKEDIKTKIDYVHKIMGFEKEENDG